MSFESYILDVIEDRKKASGFFFCYQQLVGSINAGSLFGMLCMIDRFSSLIMWKVVWSASVMSL